MVRYTIRFDNPNNHTFSVTMAISDPDPEGQKLTLPNWIPGSYMIRDFSKNIVSLEAFNSGNRLNIQKIDKSTWLVDPCENELIVQYDIFALDLSVRSAHMDNSHAFFNGTSLFLKPVEEQKNQKITLEITDSVSSVTEGWTVKTTLTPESTNSRAKYQRNVRCKYRRANGKT